MATADIVMIDVNDQPGERKVVERLAKEFGQTARITTGKRTEDMLQGLDATFAAAERGEIAIEALVLSGHSDGEAFVSKDAHRTLLLGDLETMKEKYPRAFAQVSHVTLLGCFAGTASHSERWDALFPNVITTGGFNGRGPSGKASNRFLEDVLRESLRRSRNAGGAPALAAALDRDPVILADYAKVLGALDGVRRTEWSFRVCGEFHTRVEPRDDRTSLANDLSEHYFECRDAGPACRDPRSAAYRAPLARLYTLREQHERSRATNLPLFDANQRKLHRLLQYESFSRKWYAKNEDLLREAAPALAARGVTVPAPEDFAGMTRHEQLAWAASVGAAANAAGAESLLELSERTERQLTLLRD